MSYFIIGGTNVMVGQMSFLLLVGQMSEWDKCQVGQTSGGTNVLFYYRWDKCHGGTNIFFLLLVGQMSFFIIGGTNVMVGQMSYVIIGGTNVGVGQMSYVVIGGTNVGVGQMSGGTNVGQTNVGGTCVGGTKVAPPVKLVSCTVFHS